MNTSHTSLKKVTTNSDHRKHKNTAYIRINMLYFYILYNRGHYVIIETLYSHFSWAMTTEKEDKEENVHLKNLTESSEDIKEDQYIDVTKLPNIRIDSSMLRDAVYHKMTM